MNSTKTSAILGLPIGRISSEIYSKLKGSTDWKKTSFEDPVVAFIIRTTGIRIKFSISIAAH
jgi:hypothetical protein